MGLHDKVFAPPVPMHDNRPLHSIVVDSVVLHDCTPALNVWNSSLADKKAVGMSGAKSGRIHVEQTQQSRLLSSTYWQ